MLVSNFPSSKQRTQLTHAKLSVTKCVKKKSNSKIHQPTISVEAILYNSAIPFHLHFLVFTTDPPFRSCVRLLALIKGKKKKEVYDWSFSKRGVTHSSLFSCFFFSSLHLLDPFFFPLFGFLSFLFSKPSHASSAFALGRERFLLKYSQQTNFTSSYEST